MRGDRESGRHLVIVRVDQAARPKPGHDFGQAGIGNGEAALAAAQHAGVADHFCTHVPRTMHHDRPGEGVAVGRVESLEPHRVTMGTDIEGTRSVGSRGGRVRARLVGETLEPSGMSRVGTPSMGDEMRAHAAVGKIHQVESRCTRGKGEISDADKVSVSDAVAMSLQSIERAPKESGSYLAVDSFGSPKSGPRACSSRSHAGESNLDKRTTGNYQDVELRRR